MIATLDAPDGIAAGRPDTCTAVPARSRGLCTVTDTNDPPFESPEPAIEPSVDRWPHSLVSAPQNGPQMIRKSHHRHRSGSGSAPATRLEDLTAALKDSVAERTSVNVASASSGSRDWLKRLPEASSTASDDGHWPLVRWTSTAYRSSCLRCSAVGSSGADRS